MDGSRSVAVLAIALLALLAPQPRARAASVRKDDLCIPVPECTAEDRIPIPCKGFCSQYFLCEGPGAQAVLTTCPLSFLGNWFNPESRECNSVFNKDCDWYKKATTPQPSPTETTALQTTTQEPTPTEVPTTAQEPTTTEVPTTTQEPTTSEVPTTTQEPTTAEVPTTTQEPTTTEVPTTTQEPTTTEVSTTTQQPTTTEVRTTTQEPTTTEITATSSTEASTSSSPWPPFPAPAECTVTMDILLPDPEDCGRYIRCFGGRTWNMPCPPGTLFCYEVQRCDHPWAVKCYYL